MPEDDDDNHTVNNAIYGGELLFHRTVAKAFTLADAGDTSHDWILYQMWLRLTAHIRNEIGFTRDEMQENLALALTNRESEIENNRDRPRPKVVHFDARGQCAVRP